jgi:hypothetical protein
MLGRYNLKLLERTCQDDNNRTVCSGIFNLGNGSVSLYYYQDF